MDINIEKIMEIIKEAANIIENRELALQVDESGDEVGLKVTSEILASNGKIHEELIGLLS